jgi:predicted transcriptional regulator
MKIQSLIKNEKIIRIGPKDTLAHAMSKLASSHDAAFVFNDENEYLGLINPYYSFIKSSSPANARVEHCVFHAPRIKTNYPLTKVAQLMDESKVHYLPVFDERDKFVGILSARRILTNLQDSPLFKVKIGDVLKTKKNSLLTVYEDDTVAAALSEYKKYKVSKLVVIGKEMKLKGVLSYYDLIAYLIAPKEKEQRGERTGNKMSFNYQRVKNFCKTFILTLSPDDSMDQALKLIIDKKIGSVVIVDKERHPLGIITTKDFLKLIAQGRRGNMLEITTKNLSQTNRQIIGGFFNPLNLWLKKIPDIVKARLFIKEEKQGGVFKVILSLFPRKGYPKVIKEEGKNLTKVLQKIRKD